MKSEFSSHRSEMLLLNFRRSIAAQSRISAKKAFQEAADAPAPRFWVSEARAARIISRMRQGDDPTVDMTTEKREMYRELYRRFLILEKQNPQMPVGDIVFTIVNDTAPKSYISPERARQLIAAQKKINALKRRHHSNTNSL